MPITAVRNEDSCFHEPNRDVLRSRAAEMDGLGAAAAVVADGEVSTFRTFLEGRKRNSRLATCARCNLAATVVDLRELEIVTDLEAGEVQCCGSVIGDSHSLRLALGSQFLGTEAQARRGHAYHGSNSRQFDDLRLGGSAVADADGAGLHAFALRLKGHGKIAVRPRRHAAAAGGGHIELGACLGDRRDG